MWRGWRRGGGKGGEWVRRGEEVGRVGEGWRASGKGEGGGGGESTLIKDLFIYVLLCKVLYLKDIHHT